MKKKDKKDLIITAASVVTVAAAGAVIAFLNRKTIPDGVVAVQGFDLNKYLGSWYEIARFNFKFEKGLQRCTAQYSLNQDGSVGVINRGYDPKKQKWEESKGVAKFVNSPDQGMLKVSFFRPFYSGYNVVAIDKDYKYSLVFGRNLDYLWILSREKEIPDDVRTHYLNIARRAGYDLSRLVWTKQK